MDEILFPYSPTTLILSLIGLVASIFYPFMLEQKIRIKQLPKPLKYFVWLMILWNGLAVIGSLFFNDAGHSVLKQIVFGLEALCWVQVGCAISHINELNLKTRRSRIPNIVCILGIAAVTIATILFCAIPQKIASLEFFGETVFSEHPVFIVFSIIFLIFVVPSFLATLYALFRNCMQTSDKSLIQIGLYMLGTFAFFIVLAAFFDFVLPITSSFNPSVSNHQFLQWFQYSCIFVAILCGQYFTSISFKNKNSYWFLNELVDHISDCVIYFEKDGKIISANEASLLLFQMNEDEIRSLKVQDFLPNIDVFNEGYFNNLKIKIKEELHTFNVSIFHIRQTMTAYSSALVLSDQTHSLFFQQRVKAMNKQIADYKQEFLRYQNRLNLSERKIKETENVNATLINALPFQFWSKNENGVYLTQNQKDINIRGNLSKNTDDVKTISEYELNARDAGNGSTHISFENSNHKSITEDQANLDIKDGKPVFIYQNHFIPIISATPPYKTIGLKIDITEEQRLERERNLLREQKSIHSRLEELGTICGTFAHDYNNILGSQIGFCELASEILDKLKNETDPAKIQNFATKASSFVFEATKAAKRGKDSLNTLLDTVRGTTAKEMEFISFAPYLVIEDVIKKLLLTLPSNIKISSENMDKSVKIIAQVHSLDRIISNLASNAIYAMKETGGTLSFGIEKANLKQQLVTPYAPLIPPGDYAKISIADTGTGMDSGTLERIFSPFFTTKSPGEGLGLGLSSALRLLKEGKAHFTIQTTVGSGTIFNLYWKLYKEKNDQSEEV